MTWLEINKKNLQNNFDILTQYRSGPSSIGVVLKANAYGHGIAEVIPLLHSRMDTAYVMNLAEALAIRKVENELQLGSKRILIMGPTSWEAILEASQQNIDICLHDFSYREILPTLREAKISISVHVVIDTGLSREGFLPTTLPALFQDLKNYPNFKIQGIMSHFAHVEDITEQDYARQQLKVFENAVVDLKKELHLETLQEHISASASFMTLPQAHKNSVRLGALIYGFWVSPEMKLSTKTLFSELPAIQPVLTWKSQTKTIKYIQKGVSISYGCTYRCERDLWIAVFPVGYSDGYPRIASYKAYVLIEGKRCPILGRIAMNYLMVDVSPILRDNPTTSLTAVLLGKSGEESISVQQLADWSSSIPHEVVSRISPLLKRVVV
jgi:alanine racemase